MMFQKYCRLIASLAAAFVIISIAGVTAYAEAAPPKAAEPAPAFGSVDMQRCAQESKQRQSSEDEWHSYAQSLDKTLQRLAGGSARLLAEADIHQLAALYEKAQPSAAEQKQQADLEAKADAVSAELAKLQQNASPTDADKKRFSDLNAAQQKGEQVLQAIRDEYNSRVQQRHDELLQKLTEQIRSVVAKVAKEKGLTVVFDAQVAVYTPNDITADVIKALNK